ncbi:hypothetical protein cyc_01873 [Cyclospora cayetanensis]|uniref:Cilia- and flagella-associated protein 251 n=1 Tax=Cyclospora cayetanensis TaxID=88456 RepID=A0A1D3D3R3_9EIME|nr:hypothetical protein cyc_01873 [Cyclospora cayetanensis]
MGIDTRKVILGLDPCGATTMKDVSPHGDEIISPERQHLNEHSTNNPAGSRHQEPSAPIECDHSSSSDLDSPIKLEWVYGYDSGIQNGVHSLGRSNEGRKAVFFPASNTGVVHFYADEGGDPTRFASQVLLRGHTNRISAVAVSQDRKWIATGDIGKESLLVIWNAAEAKQVKIYMNPHPLGITSVDFTPDATLLATLSSPMSEKCILRETNHQIAESEDIPSKSACQASGYRDSSPGILATATSDMYQGVAIWNWKEFGNAPLRMAVIAIPDIQHEIRFNQWDVNELLTSGRRRILFWYWHWDDVSFHFYSPALQSKTFQQKVGDITTSVFIPQSTKALSGTTDGDVVVWNLSLILDGLSRPDERRAVSILKLRNACVTCLKTFQARWIVSGFSDGAVCFYDPQLRLVRCFEDLNAPVDILRSDPASSHEAHEFCSLAKPTSSAHRQWLHDASRLPNFVLSTSKAWILEVFPNNFAHAREHTTKEEYSSDALKQHLEHSSLVLPSCVVLSYTKCAFSHDSAHLAVAHADNVVCLFRFDHRMGNSQLPEEWAFAGKRRSHYKSICGLTFGHVHGEFPPPHSLPSVVNGHTPVTGAAAVQPSLWRPTQQLLPVASPHLYSGGYPRLFSVGEDRKLVEYDVPNSFEHTGLMQRQSCIIEQRAIPSGCLALPSPVGNTDTEVLVYSSDAKAKIWSANSMSCVKTASAAMGHNGILQLAVMQEWTEAESPATFSPILIGACKEQLLGVYQLPLDGYVGQLSMVLEIFLLIAHFLHVHAPTGPSGTASIVERLPGGVTGDLYRIAKEFFYYAQLRSQGEHTTRRRRLGEDVPIEEIPNLLCALGEAPTLLELGNVMSECRGASGVLHRQRAEGQIGAAHDTPSKSHSVAFERFLELYLNQRASKAFHHSDIIDAFKQLSKGSDTNEISPEELTRLLLTTHFMCESAERGGDDRG